MYVVCARLRPATHLKITVIKSAAIGENCIRKKLTLPSYQHHLDQLLIKLRRSLCKIVVIGRRNNLSPYIFLTSELQCLLSGNSRNLYANIRIRLLATLSLHSKSCDHEICTKFQVLFFCSVTHLSCEREPRERLIY